MSPRRAFRLREVVSGEEIGKVLARLVVRPVMVALDGRLLDRPVHPFDLAVRPRVARLSEAVFDIVRRRLSQGIVACSAYRQSFTDSSSVRRRNAAATGSFSIANVAERASLGLGSKIRRRRVRATFATLCRLTL